MKFSVITIFPQMLQDSLREGLIGQALKKGLIELETLNPREFTKDLHKTVDDRPFGGGDGMVMLAAPLAEAVESLINRSEQKPEKPLCVYLSPQGAILNQRVVKELSSHKEIILICGRYAGIDQRFINQYVDQEISIGDYIISGGELAASVLIDAVARQIPGVLGHQSSADLDSFSEDLSGLLEAPQYTRPQEFQDEKVPEILCGGNHKKIEMFRRHLSWLITWQKRPDLIFQQRDLAPEQSSRMIFEALEFYKGLSNEEKKSLGLKLSNEELKVLREVTQKPMEIPTKNQARGDH
jgi:tRNA (guanine37-N1)-methyltransferase